MTATHNRKTAILSKNFIRHAKPSTGEEYLVISGKHTFTTQKNAVVNRLYQQGLISTDVVQHSVAKPGLVNLIPNPHAGGWIFRAEILLSAKI
jgi:hypothetical protein